MRVRQSYDEKLSRILRQAAAVFAAKGYHSASVRDISAATGVSLSGLYYYFDSKEELLFLIQHHCFETILERLEDDLREIEEPEERLRILVRNHLRFFVSNMREMKVLSHEADALRGEYRSGVLALKKRYTEAARFIVEALAPADGIDPRVATFSLFGMMNWIYTWYHPERDVPVESLAADMVHLFLRGIREAADPDGSRAGGEDAGARADTSIWRSP